LLLLPAAWTLPILRLSRFGVVHETGIWSGCVDLYAEGHWLLATIVGLCSIVVPTAKLLVLARLCLTASAPDPTANATCELWFARLGRWGTLDVLLVAILVASVKLGDLVEISPGPGAVVFAVAIGLSLLATASFAPHGTHDVADAAEVSR